MSHFVLRRTARFKPQPVSNTQQLSISLKSAPIGVFSEERLYAMKQDCARRGDFDRFERLSTYEQVLSQSKISRKLKPLAVS